MLEKRIKFTNKAFNYIEVSPEEIISWGGFCICGFCNEQILDKHMYLIYVLHDVYCHKCFSNWVMKQIFYKEEDILYDLKIQNQNSFNYYKNYLGDN